jgi:hypothetical protein
MLALFKPRPPRIQGPLPELPSLQSAKGRKRQLDSEAKRLVQAGRESPGRFPGRRLDGGHV